MLDTALPARWGTWQRLKNTALYGVLRAASAVWRRVPLTAIPTLAFVLGHLAATLARHEARVARQQVAAALPELSAAEQRRLVRAMFVHLAQGALELGRLPALLQGKTSATLDASSRQALDDAFAQGRGVVGVTGHIGNWELLAQVIANAGYSVSTIAKPLYDPRLTRWVHELRSAHGLGVIWRGLAGSAKDMLRVFRDGGMLALLIDQDTQVEGTFVPFFGRPAFTPTAAASLALRFNAPIVVAWTHREGGRHAFHIEPMSYTPSGEQSRDVQELTARLTARLEQAVRRKPAQWVWLHRRWKRQPRDIT